MSDSRDIDDILESLNELLREGESHNDDHVDEPSVDVEAEDVDAATHELEENILAMEEAGSDISDESSDGQVTDSEDMPVSVQRVVLTEEMLLDNPQGNLLSMAGEEEATESANEAEAIEVEPSEVDQPVERPLHLDEQRIEQLLGQVGDDVIEQLQQSLPILIKVSLHRHLNMLKDKSDDGE